MYKEHDIPKTHDICLLPVMTTSYTFNSSQTTSSRPHSKNFIIFQFHLIPPVDYPKGTHKFIKKYRKWLFLQ
jgi:hypothetical protein